MARCALDGRKKSTVIDKASRGQEDLWLLAGDPGGVWITHSGHGEQGLMVKWPPEIRILIQRLS